MSTNQTIAGVILCGGKSQRMGQDKTSLPFGPGKTMLQQTIESLARCVDRTRIVCVASSSNTPKSLPADIRVVHDRFPDAGPLEGLTVGLAAVANECEIALVMGCDMPLIRPAFIERLLQELGDHSCAFVDEPRQRQPMPGIYRTSMAKTAENLLVERKRSLNALLDIADVVAIPVDELREVDTELVSLINCNNKADYLYALRVAGIE